MDCRTTLCLVSGLLCGLVGCKSGLLTPPPHPSAPSSTSTVPAVEAEFSKSTFKPSQNGKLKPDTYVVMADVHLKYAHEKDRPEQLRNAELEKARQAYMLALKEDPKHIPARLGLARTFAELKNRQRAVEEYQLALTANPKNATVWYELGVYHGQVRDFDGAIAAFKEATLVDPDNRQFRVAYGLTLGRAGQYDASYEQLAKCMSEAQSHWNLGRMMVHNGQSDLGAAQLELALRSDPDLDDAKVLLDSIRSPNSESSGIRQIGFVESRDQ